MATREDTIGPGRDVFDGIDHSERDGLLLIAEVQVEVYDHKRRLTVRQQESTRQRPGRMDLKLLQSDLTPPGLSVEARVDKVQNLLIRGPDTRPAPLNCAPGEGGNCEGDDKKLS
ncbi:MAG: hypothetical protein B7Y86_04235 [Brevundimonas subvibrioides]|uniref:Uncharacterized protein n=1 Tax=Brevundimonas subvibrioides TaxID=74313 RepID=A0A258HNM7_9CAUL|nr:hypothetical protein [Brevundimonas subvibrioides]OYX58214.1 MAG: hypothetical protein B7Y86_04235 [Brevundimonas subvibrioides]